MKTKKHPTAYDKGQHELICDAVGTSPDPDAPGMSAYEAVCVTKIKLHYVEKLLMSLPKTRQVDLVLAQLRKPKESFEIIYLYGTESEGIPRRRRGEEVVVKEWQLVTEPKGGPAPARGRAKRRTK